MGRDDAWLDMSCTKQTFVCWPPRHSDPTNTCTWTGHCFSEGLRSPWRRRRPPCLVS